MTSRGMCGRRWAVTAALIALAAAAARAQAPPASQAATAPAEETASLRGQTAAWLVVFDFACKDKGEQGRTLADAVRMKLQRHEEYHVLDRLTTQELADPQPADADLQQLKQLMTGTLAVHVAVCGTVSVQGKAVIARILYVDFSDPCRPVQWKKSFADSSQRWNAVLGKEIVESITGKAEWKPPEIGEEPTPTNFGQPVNVGGDFENGYRGWFMPDNVSQKIVDEPGRGRVLMIRTDLARNPWLEYTRQMRFGLADPNHPPNIPTDTGEGSVGGMEGVHYYSEWIDATPGQRYWLTADVKGGGRKIFIKGYIDWTDRADGLPEASLVERKMTVQDFVKLPSDRQKAMIAEDAKAHGDRYRREVYRWYLNCGGGNRWKHVAAPVPPRGGLPANVRWIQIQPYAYWPPGSYYFDNVFLYRDPGQTAPIPEEPARTPNFEKIRIKPKE